MNRYGQARAATFLGQDRRRDRHGRTTRSQTRASSARWKALDRVWRDLASCRGVFLLAKSANQVGNVLGNALFDDVVIQGTQLLADAGLHFAPKAHFRLSLRWPSHVVPNLRRFRVRRR